MFDKKQEKFITSHYYESCGQVILKLTGQVAGRHTKGGHQMVHVADNGEYSGSEIIPILVAFKRECDAAADDL